MMGKTISRYQKSRINHPEEMRQLIDFKNLNVDGYIYPTDIDGLIEYKDKEYIIFEFKHGDSPVPLGQKLALQRIVDDFTKTGKQAMVFVCEHNITDILSPIVAADCIVREIYYGGEKRWRKPRHTMTAAEALDTFQRTNSRGAWAI